MALAKVYPVAKGGELLRKECGSGLVYTSAVLSRAKGLSL